MISENYTDIFLYVRFLLFQISASVLFQPYPSFYITFSTPPVTYKSLKSLVIQRPVGLGVFQGFIVLDIIPGGLALPLPCFGIGP